MTGSKVDAERFVRQMLVAEIGEAGQIALGSAEARVLGPSLGHEVARRYAQGAGFGGLTEGAIDAAVEVELVDPAAREVLLGSRAALRAILDAVLPGRALR